MSNKTPGQIAYEEDVMRCPRYPHDRSWRPIWAELSDFAKKSWERNPTPRNLRALAPTPQHDHTNRSGGGNRLPLLR